MPFDPTKPVEDSPLDAVEMRNQFNALNDEINDINTRLEDYPEEDGVTNRINQMAAHNVDGLATLTMNISNPPTQAQVQAILAKLNELIAGLKH